MLLRTIALSLAGAAGVSSFAVAPQRRLSVPSSTALASSAATAAAATVNAPPPLSPLTEWGERIPDIRQLQARLRREPLPEFAPEVSARALGLDTAAAQLQYFRDNADALKRMMQDHGAVVFRDFDLMKTQPGFQDFYAALGMKVCLDPLHSVSARPTVDGSKNSPVYEAVNKESRKNFFIGACAPCPERERGPPSCAPGRAGTTRVATHRRVLAGRSPPPASVTHSRSVCPFFSTRRGAGMHNEFVGTRAPRAAAFVCFKAAEEGGEFLLADGRRMFRDLDADLVEELYRRQIRYSVMELPFFGWVDSLPGFLQEPAMGVIRGVVSTAINAKVDFDVELLWGEGGYDNTRMLQARAPKQPPIVVHPVTGDPTWFCNVHSHSSKLRKDREAM